MLSRRMWDGQKYSAKHMEKPGVSSVMFSSARYVLRGPEIGKN